MKPEPPVTEKDFAKDLKTFEQLPAKTKELDLLKDQAEKATGQESVALNKMVRDKAGQGASRLRPVPPTRFPPGPDREQNG